MKRESDRSGTSSFFCEQKSLSRRNVVDVSTIVSKIFSDSGRPNGIVLLSCFDRCRVFLPETALVAKKRIKIRALEGRTGWLAVRPNESRSAG